MTASGGVVLLSAAKDRAVFLTSADLTTLRDTLEVILKRPTVAGGPLDLTGLERFARAVELAEEDRAPIVLSGPEETGLEILKEQAAIRSNLPMRIRRTCRECGYEQITNPNRQVRAAPSSTGPDTDAVATSLSLLTDGHPFLATLNLFSGSSTDSDPGPGQQPACGRCDGESFRSDTVTICPGCRAFRDESVLLTCPECEFDFSSRRVNEEFWVSPEKARTDGALARNVALLQEKSSLFENNLRPTQLQALLAALRPDEELLGMCRCGLPNQVGRYVALLFTTKQLVWTRQSPMSNLTSGTVLWPDVLAVYPFAAPSDKGIQIDSKTSQPLVFTNFRGIGLTLGAEPVNFTLDGIHALVTKLWQPHRPAMAPQPPVPGPVAPPGPGPAWYPDPWRAARLRWWNGTQWTNYLSG